MPFTGDRRGSGSVVGLWDKATLWSSSLSGNDAYYLSINSSNFNVTHSYRSFGFGVRCFKDEYVNPDNTWTVEAGTLWGAGIFHNSTLWLISVTNGSDKNITMKDKNEWATVVYNDGDTLSESNCWKYYQRWNYYWFQFTWTLPKTSSTKVNTTWYGGSNPYYSDTFINAPSSDWSNPSNDNLRANSSSAYFTPVELMELKELYLGWKYNEWQPLIPGDYTLLRWPCDEWFHVPLFEERQAIISASISSPWEKLHIPKGWFRNGNSWTRTNDSEAYLWCTTPSATYSDYIYSYNSSTMTRATSERSYGYSIRPFRNTPIIPDETRTETVTNKVWYNSDLWLITVRSWTSQYVTLQDKNVWSTEVYNGTLNDNNRWKYFQRWNNYGFTRGSTGDTSSVRVDASWYWPSNPYSSSTFIIYNGDWSSTRNDNLRWYTDFNS